MSANLQSIIAALALTADEQKIADEISVGHASRSLPFGGKLRNAGGGGRSFSPMSVGAPGDGVIPNGGSPEATLMSILGALGGRPCQIRGEPMPASDCARRLCLTQMFFTPSITGSATAEPETLLARDWFLPLVWVDYGSSADLTITSVTYKTDPIFDSNVPIESDLAFPATSNWNFIIGVPAISDKTGYVFTFANANVAAQSARIKFVGVGVRT